MKEIALNILDVLQNSLRAEATIIRLDIEESISENMIRIKIADNGKGIEKSMLLNIYDPFVTSRVSRKIGMGLALLKFHAELCAGGIEIESGIGKGSLVKVWFQKNHVDRQPLGDIAGVVRIMIASGNTCEFYYKHSTDMGEFSISTQDIKKEFELIEISDNLLLEQLKELINENLGSIHADLN